MRVGFPELGRHGRLGNQLWQIASTVGIAETLGATPSFPEEWAYREVFTLPDHWYGECDVDVRETEPAAQMSWFARSYLQDLSFWVNNVPDAVREAFRPSESAQAFVESLWDEFTGLYQPPFVSLHVRRGDNLTNEEGTINCLETAYYHRALDGFGADPVVCFTDDPVFCREEFGDRVAFVYEGVPRPKEHEEGYDEVPVDWVDLLLMARCDHHVLSNSTYSWWGAWLAGDANAVYPSYWYGEKVWEVMGDPSVMFPDEWVRLEAGIEGQR